MFSLMKKHFITHLIKPQALEIFPIFSILAIVHLVLSFQKKQISFQNSTSSSPHSTDDQTDHQHLSLQEFYLNNEDSQSFKDISHPVSGHQEIIPLEPETHEQINIPSYPKYYKRRKKSSVLPEAQDDQQKDQSQGGGVLLQEKGVSSLEGAELGRPIALRKKPRSCIKPFLHDVTHYLNFSNVSPQHKAFLLNIQDTSIPSTFHEALKSFHWKEAMNEEMRGLLQNATWEIVDLPKGKIPVSCRWVFTLKCKADGSIDRHKARLVARGYTQTYGIDYQETFAPVAKLNTIRILISLAINFDWPLQQYDIKNAFLNGDLKEDIYMTIPPGYGDSTTKGKVCKLQEALYGLKQSPRAWFGRFTQTMKTLGYKQYNGEHTLLFKWSS